MLDPRPINPVTALVHHAAELFDTTPADILSHSRLAYLVRARQAVCYVARDKLGLSYAAIGRRVGGRDPTTIKHACTTAEAWARVDEEYRWALGVLRGE